MAQPTPYNRVTSFQLAQQAAPTNPLPGDELDSELNAVKQTLDQILNNLAEIQRDDGELANGSVGRLQLNESLNLGFDAPTAWHTNISYSQVNTVFINGKFYSCKVSHISGVFATDLAAAKWELIADFAGVLGSAVNVAFTPAGTLASSNVQDAIEEVSGDVSTLQALGTNQTPAVATTQVSTDSSTKLATTAFTQAAITAAINAALAKAAPIGRIAMWPGFTLPTGWSWCDGGTFLRSDPLFAVIGTSWGAGDGVTTANRPNLKGRTPVGRTDMGGTLQALVTSAISGIDGTVLGAVGGEQAHTLTQVEMPAHGHVFNGIQINLGTVSATSAFIVANGGGTPSGAGGFADDATAAAPQINIPPFTPSGNIQSAGSGGAHQNMQPSIILNFIIYTG